jgi:hypothetical protein
MFVPTGGSAPVVNVCFCSLRPTWNFFRSVSEWMVLAAFCFLARGADSDDVDSVAFHPKASR